MKKFLRIFSVFLILGILLSAACACAKDDVEEDTEGESYSGMPEYDLENIESYIKPFVYRGLTVEAREGVSPSQVLLDAVVSGAEIIAYPTPQVEYYAEQERAKYRYFAKRDGIEYEELLKGLGVTEESIYDTARGYVKEDLVLEYIAKDEGLVLTEEEKLAYSDKYADRLADIYGRDREYIKTNMQEQMYDTMKNDKIMEYLLLNNTVAE